MFTSILWSPAVDTYYEYLRTFSQELGARIVEMYPRCKGQTILSLDHLRRFCGSRFLLRL